MLLCNGLGTNPYAWPALLDPDCGIRVISWNHRGVGPQRPARGPATRGRRRLRRGRPRRPGRLRPRPLRRGRLVHRRQHRLRAGAAPPRAGLGPLRRRRRARAAPSPRWARPLFIPRPLREPITVNTARAMKLAAPVLTPVARRIPMGPVSTTVLRFSGFMFPTARPTEVRRAVREFLTTPIDWYMHLAAARLPPRPRVRSRASRVPAVFVAGKYDVLADTKTCAPPRSASTARRTASCSAPTSCRWSGPATVAQMLRELARGRRGLSRPAGRVRTRASGRCLRWPHAPARRPHAPGGPSSRGVRG